MRPSRRGYLGGRPGLQAGGWDGRGYERKSRLAMRESALESHAPRPAASPRAPPYSACLLPASPRPQQRSSDAPPSVPVAPQHPLQLHFPEIPAALDRASGAGTGEPRSLRRPGQGLSGRFGSPPPPPGPSFRAIRASPRPPTPPGQALIFGSRVWRREREEGSLPSLIRAVS